VKRQALAADWAIAHLALASLFTSVSVLAGCCHLTIPSYRVGSVTTNVPCSVRHHERGATASECAAEVCPVGPSLAFLGALVHPLARAESEVAEAPLPKFHPLPARPVFGPIPGDEVPVEPLPAGIAIPVSPSNGGAESETETEVPRGPGTSSAVPRSLKPSPHTRPVPVQAKPSRGSGDAAGPTADGPPSQLPVRDFEVDVRSNQGLGIGRLGQPRSADENPVRLQPPRLIR
jgi:hypothetical protein